MNESTMTSEEHLSTIEEQIIKEEQKSLNLKEWDARMELALFNAISRCKPVGIHKHFRIISIQKQFNQNNPMPCTIQEIWDKLNEFYGMEALDELAEEDDEQEERNEDARHLSFQEFSLPLEDYDQLISEHRQDNRSEREESPSSPPTKRTRTSRRERSPTNSANESTPEPEEGKPSRRRGMRKSEATPEPPTGRHSVSMSSSHGSKRTARSSGSSRGPGSKRQTNKRK
ncbi:hypothetical protein RMATCC62417_05829 [Rhizopus microsporus]|nr:hypothetical protein RMATCC62417_05829 [Rhizopus microsporus]